MLQEGTKAPDFSLRDYKDNVFSLSDFRDKYIVLYFYPKDDTHRCTKEACNFRDNISDFEGNNAVIIGISFDNRLSHKNFITKYNLPFILLSDIDAVIARLYKVYEEKKILFRKIRKIRRATYIIDPEGMIVKVYNNVDVNNHSQEILNFLQQV